MSFILCVNHHLLPYFVWVSSEGSGEAVRVNGHLYQAPRFTIGMEFQLLIKTKMLKNKDFSCFITLRC